MHILRSVIQEIGGFAEFVEQVCQDPLTQGVVIDVNPIWAYAYQLEQAGLNPDAFLKRGLDERAFARQPFDRTVDFYRKYELVDQITSEVFRRPRVTNSSLLVKVIVAPVNDQNDKRSGSRSRLLELVRKVTFPALMETREPARFVVSCGDFCASDTGSLGTIGGFLEDSDSGKTYAATCGHVVAAGSVWVDGRSIGVCTHARVPTPLTSNQLCTPAGVNVNRLDIALIDVTMLKVSNRLSNIAAYIFPGESISTFGAMSGRTNYEVGGVAVVYSIGGVCFGNLFEVRPPAPRGMISGKLQSAFARVPQRGDSGAWIERTSAPDWCGILVAADHLMGYATESDSVIVEANKTFGMALKLA